MSKISARLGEWYNEHKRDLPWRATKDPYQVWLSEIILQQTQIKQGLPYFLRFIEAYPTVHHLAAASEVDILNLWQGLGYYSRAINLHKCARQISRDFQGIFPQNSVELKQLVGIGDYTAAAIASIAFSEAIAAVDGNVYRVLSRLFDIDTPINTTTGHRLFRELAEEQLDPRSPGDHNQALMEFGALVCTPKNPHCATCIFREECLALKTMTVAQRPVKLKKSKVLERWHFYFVFRAQDHLLIQKRHDHSIWKNMYDFPNVEGDSFKTLSDLVIPVSFPAEARYNREFQMIHVLSHRKIHAHFHVFDCADKFNVDSSSAFWAPKNQLQNYPWPRLMDKFLDSLFKTS